MFVANTIFRVSKNSKNKKKVAFNKLNYFEQNTRT